MGKEERVFIGSIWIIANLQVKTAKENKVVFTVWHGARKHVACLRTVKSMVENMITGVTKVSWKLSIGLAGYRFGVLAGYRGGIESQWVSGWRGGACSGGVDMRRGIRRDAVEIASGKRRGKLHGTGGSECRTVPNQPSY